jgi:hypothetical protein
VALSHPTHQRVTHTVGRLPSKEILISKGKIMMDIKDLAGLSEPLKRLIEVAAEGVGAISRPFLIKANANAKAFEIRTIAQAIADSQKLLGTTKYEDGNVIIESAPKQEILPVTDDNIEQRIIMRIAYQQAKKQSNIEQVVQFAADELRTEQEVTEEKPDSDWVTRFFDISEDISTEHMQVLWGKILAGEIKKPGSYSLRTLELLKNINQREAELFVRVGKIAIAANDKVFIPNPDNGKYLEDKFGLTFTDFLALREIGLLVPNDLQYKLYASTEKSQVVFTSGKTCIIVSRTKETPQQSLTCILFTEIGKQLFELIDKNFLADPEYVKNFAKVWRHEGVEIKSGIIIEQKDNYIRHVNLQEIRE